MAGGDRRPFIALAGQIADACRPILRRNYRRRLDVAVKADSSPVTEADREAEQAARRIIGATFPEHGIFGEEFGRERADARHVWIIDPLDGTRAFVTGRPTFGTVIALLEEGLPIGDRTTLNGDPVSTRACVDLGEAYLSTTSPAMFDAPDKMAGFAALSAKVRSTTYGGDCYQYGMVATGFLDLVVECGLVEYDYLGLVPIVAGAGGRVTDWQGRELRMGSGDRVIAAGDPRLHEIALSLL